MQKFMPFDDILLVQNQAMRDGRAAAKNHRGLNVRLKPTEIEDMAQRRAGDLWRVIQRNIQPIHTAWTGHKPQFEATYIASFLLGYAQTFPRGYEAYTFPTYEPVKRSSHAQRKHLKRILRAA